MRTNLVTASYYHSCIYYPFGSVMQGRSWSSGGYRFGFNGQERDNEFTGNYAFEYRIHDARLGRFLSVDPLHNKFPMYSCFQFAGNKPVWCIDIEGLEDLDVNFPKDQPGFVKLATITIENTYSVVTKGKGAVTGFSISEFNDVMNTGMRKGDDALIATRLPSASNQMDVLLNGRNYKLAKKALNGDVKAENKLKKRGISELFKVEIQFNVTAKEVSTVEDAVEAFKTNPNSNGIICEQMTSTEISSSPVEIRNFLRQANSEFADPDVGGMATTEQDMKNYTTPKSANFIALPNFTTMDVSPARRASHESGHNMSWWHVHCFGVTGRCESIEYEYTSEGLGTNTSNIFVSTQNLLNIINDPTNRKTIEK